MTNWRTVLNEPKGSQTYTQKPQNTQKRLVGGVSEYFEQFEYGNRTPDPIAVTPPGEGPCPKCGRCLWCRLEETIGAWECRRCLGAKGNAWKELLYVPENWKPIRADAPTLSIRCPGCQCAVDTLLNQSPLGWRCSDCHDGQLQGEHGS